MKTARVSFLFLSLSSFMFKGIPWSMEIEVFGEVPPYECSSRVGMLVETARAVCHRKSKISVFMGGLFFIHIPLEYLVGNYFALRVQS